MNTALMLKTLISLLKKDSWKLVRENVPPFFTKYAIIKTHKNNWKKMDQVTTNLSIDTK
jgi:hypothetical protein